MRDATQQTGRYRMKQCTVCGEMFAVDVFHFKKDLRCPKCRASNRGKGFNYPSWLHEDNKAIRRRQRDRKAEMQRRLAARDKTVPPVAVRRSIASDGHTVIIRRGQCPGGGGISAHGAVRDWRILNLGF